MVLNNPESRELTVGSLGTIQWPAGWTYYVGRAHYGWSSRLKRFTDEEQSLHWHVDYLVNQTSVDMTHLLPFQESGERECDLARWFRNRKSTRRLAADFGSSDCAPSCEGHGFVSERSPRSLVEKLQSSNFAFSGYVQFESHRCRWSPSS
jgi:Uri superfamily endonuclease